MSPSTAPLTSELSADPELAPLVALYVDGLRCATRQLRELADGRDRVALRRLAHNLRGEGGTYGFDAISRSAALLEDALKLGVEDVRQLAEACARVCARARIGA